MVNANGKNYKEEKKQKFNLFKLSVFLFHIKTTVFKAVVLDYLF